MTVRKRSLRHSTWKGPRAALPWVKLRRSGVRRAAECPLITFDLRLFLMIAARAGASGHAVFDPGELRELLPKVELGTGEVTLYSPRHLDQRIKALVEADLLAPDSNSRCCVMPLHVIDPPERERVYCPEHRHPFAWNRREGTAGGWVAFDSRGHVVPPVVEAAQAS